MATGATASVLILELDGMEFTIKPKELGMVVN
jgi:hypothetical protein